LKIRKGRKEEGEVTWAGFQKQMFLGEAGIVHRDPDHTKGSTRENENIGGRIPEAWCGLCSSMKKSGGYTGFLHRQT
jgi:hypothetical protein